VNPLRLHLSRAVAAFLLVTGSARPVYAASGAGNTSLHSVPLESKHLLSDRAAVRELSLDGDWQAGIDRHYDRVLRVPGLASDPGRPTPGTLWYKRTVELPAGDWTRATLTLKGARFAPAVYVNGQEVSAQEGGMAATVHRFALPSGKSFTLEIALKSLNDLDPRDASAVPVPDRWRNNVSSYLWDSVVLRLHGAGEIAGTVPFPNFKADSVALRWDLAGPAPATASVDFKVLDESGAVVLESGAQPAVGREGTVVLDLRHRIEAWSPEHPHLYRLRTDLVADGRLLDAREQSFGLRDFTTDGLGLRLNGEPYHIRMGTVVWHRWTRDPRAHLIAFDPVWFENNIVLRLKNSGANALRFHLGLPPEVFLDLCDQDGLAVQMEWPFFHGVAASRESLETQWKSWLDTAMRHPSVVIVHPWNETGEDQLKVAHSALDELLPQYPPIVVAHRDIIPIHKYWWSLFENVGLYYDSAAQFGKPVMADEFGGNYLDQNGNPGTYPAAREAFLRFLGRRNTREERLQLQADSNARIAEYWRRLGIAGFSPFCILGSPEDGNDWFLGPIDVASPTPKPVWAALAAAFAQQSLSLEIWNRNFAPGESPRIPLWFFNDGDREQSFAASVHIVDAVSGADAASPLSYRAVVQPHGSKTMQIEVALPQRVGEWRIEARLEEPVSPPAPNPVISSWHIRTFVPKASARLQSAAIAVPLEETELRAMLEGLHLHPVAPSDATAQVFLGSRATWQKLHGAPATHTELDTLLHHGKSIVLLDAGPEPLGVGYSSGAKLGGPLEGAPSVGNPATLEVTDLFGGIKLSFLQVAEPESTIQQAESNRQLWDGVPRGATWLWNGLRGGLIVPAADMQISGLGGDALLAVWQARGADRTQIASGHSFAYELAGYYAFADRGDDALVSGALRKRVKTMVEDAPALRSAINPDAPMTVTDLGALYQQASGGQAESVTPMANAGKNLTRAPVVKIAFGNGDGQVVVSQLLTAGRLLPGESKAGPGVYGLRYDPVAVQMVLNMLDAALPGPASH
jgi:beta-galactosidase